MADTIVNCELKRKQKDGSYKIYHPITKAKNVKTADGSDIESQLAENVKQIADKSPINHNHNNVYEPVLQAERKRKITFGTANPTGGVDGDIYLQYE